mmetsp:Transcript_98355/g.257013  ORF Transcript_98355/g.257013 Transcript_98355/m.257013 type:complete len:324 (+) Transcript_98355:177-1148(+)
MLPPSRSAQRTDKSSMLMPVMASPMSSETSANTLASLKCVTAWTMARARFSGFDDLKMPLPTKTPSTPSCMQSAASAGVAMPPAAKFTTGSLPSFLTCIMRSRGALISLARVKTSSSSMVCNMRISLCKVRMWRTASTILPVPASPLVRIMLQPSAMRRRASPRLRQPQTKGTLNLFLFTWLPSSATVSTSLSSMQSTPSCCKICASTKCPMRHLAMTGIETALTIALIIAGSDMRATPFSFRMSAGMRSRAMTATAPASSAIFACSGFMTSMMTPPFSIAGRPFFTRSVPSTKVFGARAAMAGRGGDAVEARLVVTGTSVGA